MYYIGFLLFLTAFLISILKLLLRLGMDFNKPTYNRLTKSSLILHFVSLKICKYFIKYTIKTVKVSYFHKSQ